MNRNKQSMTKAGHSFKPKEVQKMKPENKNNFLTNGETFGTEIILGPNDSANNWREVTPEERSEIEKQQQAEVMI